MWSPLVGGDKRARLGCRGCHRRGSLPGVCVEISTVAAALTVCQRSPCRLGWWWCGLCRFVAGLSMWDCGRCQMCAAGWCGRFVAAWLSPWLVVAVAGVPGSWPLVRGLVVVAAALSWYGLAVVDWSPWVWLSSARFFAVCGCGNFHRCRCSDCLPAVAVGVVWCWTFRKKKL